MRILIDLRALMSGKISGVEVYIQSMVEAIFEMDSQNEYILWTNNYKTVKIQDLLTHFPNVSLIQTRIPNKLFNLSLSLFRWPKLDRFIEKKTGKKIDALWVPDPRPSPVSHHCKKIITFHDLSFEDFKHTFTFKTRLWHKLLRPKKEALEASQIIAVSDFTKTQLIEEYAISPESIKVVLEATPKSFRTLDLPKGFELIQRKYKLPQEYFLCLSTLEPRKNSAGIIQAFKAWQEETHAAVHLVVAGKHYPHIFSKTELQTHPKIHFTGFIDEADKALLYQHAQGFIYTSFYEGFGLPILEAMTCGTPVITSNGTSMPQVAGNAALLVNPNDPQDLKQAIHSLHRDEVLRKDLIQKGYENIKRFSWKTAAKGFLESLKE